VGLRGFRLKHIDQRADQLAMAAFRALRLRFALLARSESGMALPTALFATIASLGLASAAVMSSVDVQHGTKRDSASKNAIAAADAGASIALLRLNRYASAFTTSTPCLGLTAETLVLTGTSAGGWCPQVSGTVGSAGYSYWVGPVEAGGNRAVVAVGTADSVSRRVAINFKTTTTGSALGSEGVIGIDEVEIDNNADARVGVGTNGSVHVHNNGNICGSIRHGVGKPKTDFDNNGTQCKGYVETEANVTLPAVSTFMPSDIATNNSNYRLLKCTKANVPAGCQSDSYVDKHGNSYPESPWSSRKISVGNGATLTLTGGDYFVCSLFLDNNSHLYIGASAQVRIFFDTPESCKLKTGARQIEVQNNADIVATGYQPTIGQFNVPGFYLMGSPTIRTEAYWSNNAGGAEMVLYGPNTDIELNNNATYTGVIAGRTVHLDNNAIVKQDAGFKPPQIGGATIFERQSYVECTGAVASPPNANC
jgi:hypothetical protein